MRHARTTTIAVRLTPRLLALAAVLALGASALVTPTTHAQTPTATGTPSATPTPARRLELAPIESAEIQIAKSLTPQYSVRVTSGLPGGCAAFDSISASRAGTRIDVTVMNSMPVGNVPCTAIYGYKDSTVDLGSDFAAGTYTVVVNAAGSRPVTKTFTVGAGGFAAPPVFSASGQALVIFAGGSIDQLEAAASAARATGAWVQDAGGAYRLLVVGGPAFLKEQFTASFSGGLSANTAATLVR